MQNTAEEFGSVFSPQRPIHESAGCSHSCHKQPMEGQGLCQGDARDGVVPSALLRLTWVPGCSSMGATCSVELELVLNIAV